MPGRRRRGWVAVVVAAAVAIALTVGLRSGSDSSGAAAPARGPGRLPALTSAGDTPSAGDLGDPAVLTVPSGISGPARYVLFGTNDWPAHVPTATSPDLKTWTPGADALPVLPAWAGPNESGSRVWAPAAARIDSEWLLYVTLPDRRSGRQCIGVTTSSRPEGPYRDALGEPLVCQASLGGSIDPSLAGPPSHRMLLWKSDGNCCGKPAILWSQSLRADGKALTGKPHDLLRATRPWQQRIVEEPAAVPAAGEGWWLFYSGGYYNGPHYAIGVAYCKTLEAPCVDRSPSPVAASVPGQRSPGGLETFQDQNGKLVAVFDTWTRPPGRDGNYHCCRAIDLGQLTHL
jgi:hypothetical protein